MDDSFRVRVDRAFGSLQSSSSSNFNCYPSSSISVSISSNDANPASLWSLTDDEIERKEWNRDKRCSDDEDEPVVVSNPYAVPELDTHQMKLSFSLQDLKADVQELFNESDEEEYQNQNADEVNPMLASSSCRQLEKPDDHNQDEWDIRASVGLDSTLDFEDEEDGYDQVAIGEEAGDLYRKDITDYEADMESSRELPKTFRDVTKDPRANRVAAQLRLKEDAEAVKNLKGKLETGDLKCMLINRDDQLVAMNLDDEEMDAGDLRPTLIKRDDQLVMKSEKRVTFASRLNDDNGQDSGHIMEGSPTTVAQVCPSVPDHVRNPSKYTHYTFDSLTDASEEGNTKAYMDFLNLLRGPKTTETLYEEARYLPKSVTFTPKKKPVDSSMKNWTFIREDKEDGNEECVRIPLGIAAEEAQDSEMCAMEEDEPELASDKSANLPKAGRRYRTRAGISSDKPVY